VPSGPSRSMSARSARMRAPSATVPSARAAHPRPRNRAGEARAYLRFVAESRQNLGEAPATGRLAAPKREKCRGCGGESESPGGAASPTGSAASAAGSRRASSASGRRIQATPRVLRMHATNL
jgi:hypothetical protein